MVAVARRLREAASLPAIAQALVEELAALGGVRSVALVLCDAAGAPALWIGDATVDRDAILAYLHRGFRDDAAFARVCRTYVPERAGDTWTGPLLGAAGVVGTLRVVLDREVDRGTLATIAAAVSVRIAVLGLALDDARAAGTLTPRQREVAALVAHGCTNPEIARMLAISANAVKKHVSRVLRALEVSNRTELAGVTARWRIPTEAHQVLPPTIQLVVRNPAKSPGATSSRSSGADVA